MDDEVVEKVSELHSQALGDLHETHVDRLGGSSGVEGVLRARSARLRLRGRDRERTAGVDANPISHVRRLASAPGTAELPQHQARVCPALVRRRTRRARAFQRDEALQDVVLNALRIALNGLPTAPLPALSRDESFAGSEMHNAVRSIFSVEPFGSQ